MDPWLDFPSAAEHALPSPRVDGSAPSPGHPFTHTQGTDRGRHRRGSEIQVPIFRSDYRAGSHRATQYKHVDPVRWLVVLFPSKVPSGAILDLNLG